MIAGLPAEYGLYTAVVMTWGPGQKTPLHDHAGMWCVECVVEGELEVVQFDLMEQADGRCRFDAWFRTLKVVPASGSGAKHWIGHEPGRLRVAARRIHEIPALSPMHASTGGGDDCL